MSDATRSRSKHAVPAACPFALPTKGGKTRHRKGTAGVPRTLRAPLLRDGRHPDVADAGAHDEVVRLSRDFRGMSGQTLLSLSVGTCQQLVGAVSPLQFPFSSQRDELPADRAGHVALLRSDHTIRSTHLAWVTHTINQLVAVEHALAEHVMCSVNGIEAHEATTDPVCTGCTFTAADFSYGLSAPLGLSSAVKAFARGVNARGR